MIIFKKRNITNKRPKIGKIVVRTKFNFITGNSLKHFQISCFSHEYSTSFELEKANKPWKI